MFDSGVGGLAVLKAFMERAGEWDYVYLADVARAPFGMKGDGELLDIVLEDIAFLLSRRVDLVVAACNTADSVLKRFSVNLPFPYAGILEGAAGMVMSEKIGVLSTEATARLGVYEEIFPGRSVLVEPAQELVALVESGVSESDLRKALEPHLEKLERFGTEDLVLGCTHFSLVKDVIGEMWKGRVVDPVEGLVERIAGIGGKGKGRVAVYTTGDPVEFRGKMKRIGIEAPVEGVVIGEEALGDIGAVRGW